MFLGGQFHRVNVVVVSTSRAIGLREERDHFVFRFVQAAERRQSEISGSHHHQSQTHQCLLRVAETFDNGETHSRGDAPSLNGRCRTDWRLVCRVTAVPVPSIDV